MKTLTHFSLFSGVGGADLAAEWAGFESIGQVEWADYPTKVLEKHWPHLPRWRDIKDVSADNVRRSICERHITVISGGFPCQPFSVAGKRKGKDDDRFLWPEMLRVISELKPTWVIGENVNGFVNMGLEDACVDLENEGFEVQPFIIPACSVGAWHERKRVFIVAYSKSNQNRGQHMPKLFEQNSRMELTSSGEGFDGEKKRCDMATGIFADTTSDGRNCGQCNRQERQIQSNKQWDIEKNKSERERRITRVRKICSVFQDTRCELQQRFEQFRALQNEARKRDADFIERPSEMVSDSAFSNRDEYDLVGEYGQTTTQEIFRNGSSLHRRWEWWKSKSNLGGMVNGIPDWVDGYWEREPEGILRVTNGTKNRKDRLKCLGNAIVPQQIYPIFKAIAQIEEDY